MDLLKHLNFKNARQRDLWQKVMQDLKTAMQEDSKTPENLKEIKRLSDLYEHYLTPIVASLDKNIEPELAQDWPLIIDKVKDENLRAQLEKVSAQSTDPTEGWNNLPEAGQTALKTIRVMESFEIFTQAIPEKARDKISALNSDILSQS